MAHGDECPAALLPLTPEQRSLVDQLRERVLKHQLEFCDTRCLIRYLR